MSLIVVIAAIFPSAGCGETTTGPSPEKPAKPSGLYTEVRAPEAGPADGTMLLFHGGAWRAQGAASVKALRTRARVFQRLGWRTLNTTYRDGRVGLQDVEATFDYAKTRWPGQPICAYGESSGGHWALMLATTRNLDCVVVAGAPTDLTSAPQEVPSGQRRNDLARVIQETFGSKAEAFSPIRLWDRDSRTLLILLYAKNDPVVALQQARRMLDVARNGLLISLPAGNSPFVHTGVDPIALDRAVRTIDRKLEGLP